LIKEVQNESTIRLVEIQSKTPKMKLYMENIHTNQIDFREELFRF